MTAPRQEPRRRPWPRLVAAGMLLLAAMFAGVPAGAQPERRPEDMVGILGADDRVPIESQAWPWAAIGRINRAAGGYCTGTLVGPRLVLTAAHCLQGHPHPANIHFVAGYSRERYVGHAVGATIVYADGYRPDRATEPDTLTRDWALLVLATPLDIPPVPVEPLPAEDLTAAALEASGAELVRPGYSRDRPYLLSAHVGCAVTGAALEGRLLLHACDATIGDSGSPLLLRRGDDVAIVGLHVAVGEGEGAETGVAVPAAAFAEAIRAAE